MFGIFGGTETRRLPGRFQVPWKEILFVVIVLIAVGAVAFGAKVLYSNFTGGESAAPAQAVEQPVAQPVQQVPVADPVKEWPKVEVVWQEISRDSVPSGRFSFVPGATIRTELGFSSDQVLNGHGDGVAFFIQTGELKDREFFFTPNGGKGWFHVNHPLDRTVSVLEPTGAFIEGETLILFAVTEPQPWVIKNWRAEIPLSQLQSLP